MEDYGERALVVIDAKLTHAVRKQARFMNDDEHVTGPVKCSAQERTLVDQVLKQFDVTPLYLRVDLTLNPSGKPWVMEVELIEPSLFFKQYPPALDLFVKALLKHLH